MESPATTEVAPIVFDDAGGGNIMGGLVIAGMRGSEYKNRIIGPEWFSVGQGIRSMISSTVLEILKEYGDSGHVVLCRSDLFDQTARDLERLGYKVERAVIEGVLQDRAERDFYSHLIDLGLPEFIMTLFPGEGTDKSWCYRSLNQFCMSFLLADFPSRGGFAKQNSRSYQKMQSLRLNKKFRTNLNGGRPRRCVECGGEVAERAWQCKAESSPFYIHEGCEPW